jgi:hypothetical protein
LGAVLLVVLQDLTDLPDLHGASQIWPFRPGFTGTARICPNLLPSFLGRVGDIPPSCGARTLIQRADGGIVPNAGMQSSDMPASFLPNYRVQSDGTAIATVESVRPRRRRSCRTRSSAERPSADELPTYLALQVPSMQGHAAGVQSECFESRFAWSLWLIHVFPV